MSRKRVERLMRCASLSGLVRRRRGRTTIRVPGVAVVPDRLWVADLTYLCAAGDGPSTVATR